MIASALDVINSVDVTFVIALPLIEILLNSYLAPPPGKVVVQTLAKDKIFMKWEGIPSEQITDTLAYYELEYWKNEDPANKTTTTVNSGTQKEISGLEIYTLYCFEIRGVLASGVQGNKSEAVCNSTDESGMNLLFYKMKII